MPLVIHRICLPFLSEIGDGVCSELRAGLLETTLTFVGRAKLMTRIFCYAHSREYVRSYKF